jgi:hypothetical protein
MCTQLANETRHNESDRNTLTDRNNVNLHERLIRLVDFDILNIMNDFHTRQRTPKNAVKTRLI